MWNWAEKVSEISLGIHSLHGKHSFKYIYENDRTLLYSKQFCNDEQWRPPVVILNDTVPTTLAHFVRQFPLERVESRLDVSFIQELRTSIGKLRQQLPIADYNWWKEFLDNGIIAPIPHDHRHPLRRLALYKQLCLRQAISPSTLPSQNTRSSVNPALSDTTHAENRKDITVTLNAIGTIVSPPPLTGETDVYVGPLRRPDTERGLLSQLQPGVSVVVVHDEEEYPEIAQVESVFVEDKEVTVAWYLRKDDTYTAQYTRKPGSKRFSPLTQTLFLANIEFSFKNLLNDVYLPKQVLDKWLHFKNLRQK